MIHFTNNYTSQLSFLERNNDQHSINDDNDMHSMASFDVNETYLIYMHF